MELGTGVGDRARAGLSTGVGLARAGGAYLHQRFVARDSRIDVRTARELIRLVAGLRGTSVKALQLLAMERDLFTPAAAAEIERACFGLPPIATYVVTSLLRGELGSGWRGKLVAFERQPFAAASIGQVHRGRLADGRAAAVKIQYPGIRARIDSDLGTLGRLLRFAEQPHYYRALLAELRVRLRQECDYRVEARHLGLFHRYGSADGIDVPEVVGEASTDVVLTTSMADGEHVSAWLDTGPARPALDALTMVFAVSADEEHVEWRALGAGPAVELGARSFNYALLTLARARLADAHLPAPERGWRDRDALADGLGLDAESLRVSLYRARRHLAAAGVDGAGGLIERRRGSGLIRIGVGRLEVRSL